MKPLFLNLPENFGIPGGPKCAPAHKKVVQSSVRSSDVMDLDRSDFKPPLWQSSLWYSPDTIGLVHSSLQLQIGPLPWFSFKPLFLNLPANYETLGSSMYGLVQKESGLVHGLVQLPIDPLG